MSRENSRLVMVAAAIVVVAVVLIIVTASREPEPDREAAPAPTGGLSVPEPCRPGMLVSAAQDKTEAERQRQLEQEQQITVVIEDYPADVARGSLAAVYDDGTNQRRFYDAESPGRMTLKGPNILGGELAVYVAEPNKPRRLWCYAQSLAKRHVNLPDDAELVITHEDIVDVELAFAKEDLDLLTNCRAIAFYASADSKVGLFYAPFTAEAVPAGAVSKMPLKIVPGRYHMRAIITKDLQQTSVPLGMVEISEQTSTAYPVEVPYK